MSIKRWLGWQWDFQNEKGWCEASAFDQQDITCLETVHTTRFVFGNTFIDIMIVKVEQFLDLEILGSVPSVHGRCTDDQILWIFLTRAPFCHFPPKNNRGVHRLVHGWSKFSLNLGENLKFCSSVHQRARPYKFVGSILAEFSLSVTFMSINMSKRSGKFPKHFIICIRGWPLVFAAQIGLWGKPWVDVLLQRSQQSGLPILRPKVSTIHMHARMPAVPL